MGDFRPEWFVAMRDQTRQGGHIEWLINLHDKHLLSAIRKRDADKAYKQARELWRLLREAESLAERLGVRAVVH